MPGDPDVTTAGKAKIVRWLAAQRKVDAAQQARIEAGSELRRAAEDLAKWLKPHDAAPGEKFSVWFVDSLVQVEVAARPRDGEVCAPDVLTIRTRGRSAAHGV